MGWNGQLTDAFDAISLIAEQKIREAQQEGAFDNLPGNGAPLELEDDGAIPPDLRMAYKILKNAGCLPPEIQDRKEAVNLVSLLENCPDEKEKTLAMRRLRFLLGRMSSSKAALFLEANDLYQQKILAVLEKHERMRKK